VTAIGLTQSGGPEAVKAAASGCAAIALSELVFDHRRDGREPRQVHAISSTSRHLPSQVTVPARTVSPQEFS
jgi:hypothetical protein